MASEDSEKPAPEQPQAADEIESLSGDEGKDKPAPPRTDDDAMPKQPDTTEPVTDVEAEEVALAGDGKQPPIQVAVPEPPIDATTAKGPMVSDLVDDSQSHHAEQKAAQMETEKATMSMAIVVAILVALVLVGLAYAALITTDDGDTNDTPTNSGSVSTLDTEPVNRANTEALPFSSSDELQVELDTILQNFAAQDDAVDFPEAELSDETLELQ